MRAASQYDRDGADQAATQAMRKTFSFIHVRGRVVIGEGHGFSVALQVRNCRREVVERRLDLRNTYICTE